MALSYVGGGTGTTSATPPSHQAGDLFVGYAFRDGSNTPPTLPAGWRTINSSGANTCSALTAYKIANGAAETASGFTNATSFVLQVYRSSLGAGHVRPGGGAVGGAASTNVAYNTFSLTDTGGTSWVAGFAGHRSVDTALENAPTGMGNRNTVVDATDEAAGHDTNGTVSSWSTQTVAAGGTSSGWRSYALELREIQATGITLVDSVVTQNDASGTALASSPAVMVAAGDLIVVLTSYESTAAKTLVATDTHGSTWTTVQDKHDATPDCGVNIAWALAAASGSDTTTATMSAACTFRRNHTYVFANVAQTTPNSDGSDSDSNLGSASPSTGPITPAANGALFVAIIVNSGGDQYAPGGSFIEQLDTGNGSQSEYLVQAVAASLSASWTCNSIDSVAAVAVFKAATAGAASYEVVAAGGTYALTGAAVGLQATRIFDAGGGTYAITGASVTFPVTRQVIAAGGVYAITGADVELQSTRIFDAAGGTYLITGAAVALQATRIFDAGGGTYLISGADVSLEFATSGAFAIDAEGGTYLITGADVSLEYGPVVVVAGGGTIRFHHHHAQGNH